jgi:molecular chaperone GrpE
MKKKKSDTKVEETQEKVENLTEDILENGEAVKEEETEVSELDKVQQELTDSKDKYLRLYSEFENYRRRTAKEKSELISTAAESVLTALLPVLDDFERAAKSFDDGEQSPDALKEGQDLIYQKFKNTLIQKGLKNMDIGPGSDFDPDFHEAITQIPVEDETLKGKIVDVIEKGYMLQDKVIRYAKVVTGS